MRAQCSICSDLFDGELPIAAIVTCGHTFHDMCLAKWLAQSKTCPQCRKPVKLNNGVCHRLFFDEADEDDEVSPSKLQNDISSLQASLRERDREKNNMIDEKENLQSEIKQLQKEKQDVNKLLRSEKAACSLLRKEMTSLQLQQEAAAEAIREAHHLREKLHQLSTLQTVVTGLECDVQDMIGAQSDIKQLATWCTVLKNELATKRTEYKKLKETFERLNKENNMRKRELIEKSQGYTSMQERLKHSEEDLKRSEQEITSLKKKISHLQSSIESPSNTKDSLMHRMIMESPAPQPLKKRPRFSSASGDEGSSMVDLNITPDLFESPSPAKPSPATVQAKKHCQEFGTQYVKIGNAAKSHAKTREVSDISNQLPYMNIFKKSSAGGSGFMKKGYNGFGGHEKFVTPFVKPSSNIVPKKPGKLSAKMRNLGPAPALPTLDSFMNGT